MDPLETVRVNHDSTFALMLAAQARGHRVVYFEQGWLHFQGDSAQSRMREVRLRAEPGRHFDVVQERVRRMEELDVLFLRKDPPVDAEFLHATQLVELCPGRRPVYLNSPRGLRDANEKLFSLQFADLMPQTCVSSDASVLRAFIESHPAGVILKPVDGFGGLGIVFVKPQDRNTRSLLELMTRGAREAIVAQAYVEESRLGDKRIVMVDGVPVGAVLRVPAEDDHRGNMAAGGQPKKTGLTARDLEICERLKPALRAHGLLLVGIDVLGSHLTEINVTSPTGLVEIDQLDGVSVGSQVLELAERLAAARV